MKYVVVPLLGFANGVIVGSGIVALLAALDIIPRLTQLTKTYTYAKLYQDIIIVGAILASIISLMDLGIRAGKLLAAITGLFMGGFIGLLASALAEVLNVMPVVVKRFRLEGYETYIVYALILGKVIGSLLNWLTNY